MKTPSRKFITMHESEAGFDSPAEVQDYIDRNYPHDKKSWRVVEIYVDPVTEHFANLVAEQERKISFNAGAEAEKTRLLQLLKLYK